MTGRARIVADEAATHKVIRPTLYSHLVETIDTNVAVADRLRTLSGNISVRPQRRSANVSSMSYTKKHRISLDNVKISGDFME